LVFDLGCGKEIDAPDVTDAAEVALLNSGLSFGFRDGDEVNDAVEEYACISGFGTEEYVCISGFGTGDEVNDAVEEYVCISGFGTEECVCISGFGTVAGFGCWGKEIAADDAIDVVAVV